MYVIHIFLGRFNTNFIFFLNNEHNDSRGECVHGGQTKVRERKSLQNFSLFNFIIFYLKFFFFFNSFNEVHFDVHVLWVRAPLFKTSIFFCLSHPYDPSSAL